MKSGQRLLGERVDEETRWPVLHVIRKWPQSLQGASPLMCPSSVLQCSAECGAGVRTRSVVCMTNHIGSLPLEGCGNNRPAEATPCDNGPCTGKVEWFAGSWSQVSGQSWLGSSTPGKRANTAEAPGNRTSRIPGILSLNHSHASHGLGETAYALGASFSQQCFLSTYYVLF